MTEAQNMIMQTKLITKNCQVNYRNIQRRSKGRSTNAK